MAIQEKCLYIFNKLLEIKNGFCFFNSQKMKKKRKKCHYFHHYFDENNIFFFEN